MAHTYEELKKMTVEELREIAAGLDHEAVQGYTQTNKEHLLPALCTALGIEARAHHEVKGVDKAKIKGRIKELKKNFERPLIIIEGCEDIYGVRNVHPNAIRGMLATITISYGIPVIQTNNAKESSQLLLSIARREQDENGREFSFHFDKRGLSETQMQEYIVSSLPNVGGAVAKQLLKHFGSVEKVIGATEEELKQVPGVGNTIAKRIREILEKKYK